MEYIAYCGLLCNECPVYIATKENNDSLKEKLATDYSNENMKFSKEDMNCLGCRELSTKDSKMCGICTIRNCAEKKKVGNCGYCSDYPCSEINTYVGDESENRSRLDKICASFRE